MYWLSSRLPAIAVLLCASLTSACRPSPATPDAGAPLSLAIVNAHIWTGDPSAPTADAVGIVGDHIAMVGTSDEIRQRATPDTIIDAHGQFVAPGFVDTHARFDEDATAATPAADTLSDRGLDEALQRAAAHGVTTLHHMGSWADLQVIARAWRERRLPTRVYAAVPLDQWEELEHTVAAKTYGSGGLGDDWLRIGMVSGAIDDASLAVTAPAIFQQISSADRAGLQVAMEADGRNAPTTLIRTYDRVIDENGARDRRFRIEDARDLGQFRAEDLDALNLIARLQPQTFADGGALRTLLDAKVTLVFGGSSAAAADPLQDLYTATAHMSIDEALTAYTRGGAYASFEEGEKGIIAPGRLADLVIVDRDLRTVDRSAIATARIVRTIVGGRTVFPVATP